jgi:predicted oxidoreductase
MTCPRVAVSDELSISAVVAGCWRLMDQATGFDMETFFNDALDAGISSFDHADLYGDYQVEKEFGKRINLTALTRESIEIISKCGIQLVSSGRPENKIKSYDYKKDYIIQSAENSVKALKCEYLDALLLHRPSPLLHPGDVAAAFESLFNRGIVRNFGVSNFNHLQVDMLQKSCNQKLLINQVEIHPLKTEIFANGELDFCLKNEIVPMAWSPTGQGRLFKDEGKAILKKLEELGSDLEVPAAAVLYSWFASHPSRIVPVLGTVKKDRLLEAVQGIQISLTNEQWFSIYEAALGHEVP